MIITTNKETQQLKSKLDSTMIELTKTRNLNKEVRDDIERFNSFKEDERNGLKRQVSSLIDQVYMFSCCNNNYCRATFGSGYKI